MGLFGLIRQAGEAIRVDVQEWMGTEYFKATAIAAVALFVEEVTNAYMVAKLNLTGNRATLYKTLHRLAFSALYYYGIKSTFNDPLSALTASMMPIVMAILELVNKAFKTPSPQALGARLAARTRGGAVAAVAAAPTPPPPPSPGVQIATI